MKNIKLIRKLVMLSVLLGVFGYMAFLESPVVGALPCCRDCLGEEEACGLDCYNLYGWQTNRTEQLDEDYASCLADCHAMGQACAYTPCTTSCSGGCTDSSECGPGDCYCTGTRCTCF